MLSASRNMTAVSSENNFSGMINMMCVKSRSALS